MISAKTGHHTYIDGYIEDRVKRGDERKYLYPANGLPDFKTEFPELEPSFLSAQKARSAQSQSA